MTPVTAVETALYRYFDAGDLPLYIGITDNLDGRERGHSKSSCWMQFVARSTVERYPDRDAALRAERTAIETEHPLFNRQYNNTAAARDRQKAYLEKIGRMDLYKKWTLWRPPWMGELDMREARRKKEQARASAPAEPEPRTSVVDDLEVAGEPFYRFGFNMLGGLATWYGHNPITQDDAAGMIQALHKEFPELAPPAPVPEQDCPDEYEVSVWTAFSVVTLTVEDYVSNVAQIYMSAGEAMAIADALHRHAAHARRRGPDWATTSLKWHDKRLHVTGDLPADEDRSESAA